MYVYIYTCKQSIQKLGVKTEGMVLMGANNTNHSGCHTWPTIEQNIKKDCHKKTSIIQLKRLQIENLGWVTLGNTHSVYMHFKKCVVFKSQIPQLVIKCQVITAHRKHIQLHFKVYFPTVLTNAFWTGLKKNTLIHKIVRSVYGALCKVRYQV